CGDGIDGDDAAGPAREVGELQRFQAAADADIDDRVAPFQVAGIDRRAAAVVHFQHQPRHDQVRQLPHRRGRAAQTGVWAAGGLRVDVGHSLQVILQHGFPPDRDNSRSVSAIIPPPTELATPTVLAAALVLPLLTPRARKAGSPCAAASTTASAAATAAAPRPGAPAPATAAARPRPAATAAGRVRPPRWRRETCPPACRPGWPTRTSADASASGPSPG